MKQKASWIHHPDDGRGVRKVFLDGQEIKMAVFVDEQRIFRIVARGVTTSVETRPA